MKKKVLKWPTVLSLNVAAIFLVNGCTNQPKSFNLIYPQNTQNLFYPPAPQTSRYEYLGDLIGEVNYHQTPQHHDSFLESLLTNLTGIERKQNDQLMLRPVNGLTLSNNNVLVADAGRHAIFYYDVNQHQLHIWYQITSQERFINPVGLAIGLNHSILVTDAGHGEVFIFDHQGKLQKRFGKGILNRPTGLAFDKQTQRIYVCDTQKHEIAIFSAQGHYLDSIGSRGHSEVDLAFNFPTFIAIKHDRLYVSDTMNARVVVVDTEGKLLRIIGKRGFKLSNFNRPKGIALDSMEHLYVVESYFDHLLIFNQSGQFLLPIGGTGNAPGQFYLPSGVWVDSQDRIYIADMENGRVSVFQYLGESSN